MKLQQLPLCTGQRSIHGALLSSSTLHALLACHASHCFPSFLQGEEETLFVDPAVYSRNRAFRLYLSSKAGKQVGTFNCSPRAEKRCFKG